LFSTDATSARLTMRASPRVLAVRAAIGDASVGVPRSRDPRVARWLKDFKLLAESTSPNWDGLIVLASFPFADVGATLALAASKGRTEELRRVLEKLTPEPTVVGDASSVSTLLRKEGEGAWDEALTRAGKAAAAHGQRGALDVLLEHGMPCDGCLLDACCSEVNDATRAECVSRLLEAGADANCHWSRMGWKPLHAVAKRGDCESVELLVRGGADVDAKYYNGKTALFSACEWGKAEAAKTLLRLGASVDVGKWEADHLNTDHSLGASNDPVSPRDVAVLLNHVECIKVIDAEMRVRGV